MARFQLVFKGQTWFGLAVSVVAAATAGMVWGAVGALLCFLMFAGGTLLLEARGEVLDGARELRQVAGAALAAPVCGQIHQHGPKALVQQGLRSRFAIRGRYSWQEGAQVQFNRWLTPRYQKAWAALKAGDAPAPANTEAAA